MCIQRKRREEEAKKDRCWLKKLYRKERKIKKQNVECLKTEEEKSVWRLKYFVWKKFQSIQGIKPRTSVSVAEHSTRTPPSLPKWFEIDTDLSSKIDSAPSALPHHACYDNSRISLKHLCLKYRYQCSIFTLEDQKRDLCILANCTKTDPFRHSGLHTGTRISPLSGLEIRRCGISPVKVNTCFINDLFFHGEIAQIIVKKSTVTTTFSLLISVRGDGQVTWALHKRSHIGKG